MSILIDIFNRNRGTNRITNVCIVSCDPVTTILCCICYILIPTISHSNQVNMSITIGICDIEISVISGAHCKFMDISWICIRVVECIGRAIIFNCCNVIPVTRIESRLRTVVRRGGHQPSIEIFTITQSTANSTTCNSFTI